MKRFWDWLMVSDAKPQPPVKGNEFWTNTRYTSRLDVRVDITGDIDYVLQMLPIVTKQLKAADGRPTDAP